MKWKIGLAVAVLLAMSGASAFAQGAPNAIGSNSASASSWLAGAQAGYNWQRNAFIYGFEADISATHLQSEMDTVLHPIFVPPATADTSADIDWYGTVRGRLGWASGPVLFYGTGGVAYGNVNASSSVRSPLAHGTSLFLSSQASSVKAGWVLGGGIDYQWTPNVIVSVGYQYVDLGSVSLTGSTAGSVTLSQIASTHAQFQMVTAGLSWRVSPADWTPHGTWEGLYVGGHAGGAWGSSTNADYSASPPPP